MGLNQPYRRESIRRAIRTLKALNRRNGVTASELADILEFTAGKKKCRHNAAKRWIDEASLEYPIAEIGKRRSFNSNGSGGPLATIYKHIGGAINA